MRTALSIFWHDLKQLARNPFALIVALGIIVLPSVYAWYSIAAMWNPYGQTDGLKVALVSEDAGVSLDDIEEASGIDVSALSKLLDGKTELNVGDLMVDAVRENHDFNWQFVDADQGRTGLQSGEYYAEFVLPEGFTSDFLSVLSGKAERPTIEYWVNEKYSAVALEVTDAGAGVVDAVINRVFSSLVADTLAKTVKSVASRVVYAGNAVGSTVKRGLDGAASDLNAVSVGISRAGKSIDGWSDTVSSARKTLDSLKATAPGLRTSLDEGKKMLADARTASHEVASAYSSALAQGGDELSKVLGDIADRIAKVASQVSSNQSDIDSALKKARKALEESEKLLETLSKSSADQKVVASLVEQNEKLQDEIDNLEDASEQVGTAASEADKATSSLSKDIGKTVKSMKGRGDAFNSETLPNLETSLDSLSLVMGSLDGALGSLDAQIDQAKSILDQLGDVLDKTKEALQSTTDALEVANDSLDSARSDLSALAKSEAGREASEFANIDVKSYGTFMAAPVEARVQQVYPLDSYGAGVAPFYTNLAIWVGCFMLIAVIKLEVDPRRFPGMRPWHGYVGRLLLFTLMALLQGAVVTAGDIALGVQTVGPVSFVVAGLVTAFCFVNIVYALAITFKHVGKALAVILLIVQIPGASGMYPIQLMPEFFQALYPWLPFTYGMDAMREAIGGFYDGTYVQCLLWLAACGLAALAFALIVRPHVLNLNRLFDRKLAYADVFVTEEHGLGTDVREDNPVLSSLYETYTGRMQLEKRMESFAQRYSIVQQAAPLAVVILTVCLGIVSSVLDLGIDGKLVALSVFIVAIVVVFCVCVAFEYAYDNLTAQFNRLRELDGDQPFRSPAHAFTDVSWDGFGGEGPEEGRADAGQADAERVAEVEEDAAGEHAGDSPVEGEAVGEHVGGVPPAGEAAEVERADEADVEEDADE